MIYHFFLILILPLFLSARPIQTFYGSIDVEETVILELIDSPEFQRLKKIHQYGVSYYTSYKEEYNRYDHSIGVFATLRKRGACLEEQIAGLLHDVSHTVFSHVGDWIFGKENQIIDYQDSIHLFFLEKTSLGTILKKHHFLPEKVLPDLFSALENSLPNLSADRIDYNIQGAYYQGFISYREALAIFNDLQYIDERWVSTQVDLMKKLTRFSLYMTLNCWGGPTNHLTSRWLADALIRAIKIQTITADELHHGTDEEVWDKLISSNDECIQEAMEMILNAENYFETQESNPDLVIKSKFRGINPWVFVDGAYRRICEIDPQLIKEFEETEQRVRAGFGIKFLLKEKLCLEE